MAGIRNSVCGLYKTLTAIIAAGSRYSGFVRYVSFGCDFPLPFCKVIIAKNRRIEYFAFIWFALSSIIPIPANQLRY
jgi:hypothetical protein